MHQRIKRFSIREIDPNVIKKCINVIKPVPKGYHNTNRNTVSIVSAFNLVQSFNTNSIYTGTHTIAIDPKIRIPSIISSISSNLFFSDSPFFLMD